MSAIVHELCDFCTPPEFFRYGGEGDIWICPRCSSEWEIKVNHDLKLPWAMKHQMYWERKWTRIPAPKPPEYPVAPAVKSIGVMLPQHSCHFPCLDEYEVGSTWICPQCLSEWIVARDKSGLFWILEQCLTN